CKCDAVPASPDMRLSDTLFHEPLHLLPYLPILCHDACIGEDPLHQAVSHVLPVLLPLHHLPEDCRTWIGMYPQVVVTEHSCPFECNRIIRCKVAAADPRRAGVHLHTKEIAPLLYPGPLFVPPTVMVPPLDSPALFPENI